MRITEFDIYKELLRERSGMDLMPDDSSLLESRLNPIAKKWGYPSMKAMTAALQGVPDKKLIIDVVEAMTSGDTSFFRDLASFETLQKTILPYLIKKRGKIKKLRIWCAGCSTGQEPYSVALLLKEANLPAGWKIEIVATDLSNEYLEQAKTGNYSQHEVQRGLRVQSLLKYFDHEDQNWTLTKPVRKMVEFEYHNLLDDMKEFGVFDVIFCRNVLSYMNETVRQATLERLTSQLQKDGFLFLGNKEQAEDTSEPLQLFEKNAGIFNFKDSPYQA